MMNKVIVLASVTVMALLTFSPGAFAAPVILGGGVICTTNNTPANCTSMSAQISLTVSLDSGLADFMFTNGAAPSVVTELYWSDLAASLSDPMSLLGSTGTAVMAVPGGACNPDHVPGANDITWNLCFGAAPPPSSNGTKNGESATFRFGYDGDASTLAGALLNGDILVGMHVQAFSNGLSEGGIFVFDGGGPPSEVVPEPASLAMAGGGLLALACGLRRIRRS